ncbi:MAG: hypothetical protein NVSMB33_17260 [Ktedonobacteraceae bacterium]
MLFPYERYHTLAEPLKVYYPTGEETLARWIVQSVTKAGKALATLLQQPVPSFQVLLAAPADWHLAPRDVDEELSNPQPYWTDTTSPPTIVVPLQLDPIFGEPTEEKLAFILYHEVVLAFLENDPRPYPEDYPLWADEWQLKFAALWLAQQLDGQQGMVNKDLQQKYGEIFEPEADGKTPITIRSFDWFEDTTPEDYLCYELLLEQLAADLLADYSPEVLPRFLALYRKDYATLLSDEITEMLASALGAGGAEWLDELVYF